MSVSVVVPVDIAKQLSSQLLADVKAGQRTQWPYDLSGVKYKTKSDMIRLETQWNTFERVENINFLIYLRFLSGDFSKTWYQFVTNTEAADYRAGQTLHISRYPMVPPVVFSSICFAPLPQCKTSFPTIYGQVQLPSSATPIKESQKTENNHDMAIYVQVSTFNVLHSTFTYQFASNEELMAYYRAELRVMAAQDALLHPRPIAGFVQRL